MNKNDYNYLYGPVPSRRLGLSLGVDLVPMKVCSLNCVYCQLGATPETSLERAEYAPVDAVCAELKAWSEEGGQADYITMAGSGEPTLHAGLETVIDCCHAGLDIPVAVITNGSLLPDPEVRAALLKADLVVPSLDAGTAGVFGRINRPHQGLDFKAVVKGLEEFAAAYTGRLWLEIFLVQDINTDPEELQAIKGIIDRVSPERVQINTVVRPPADAAVKPAQPEILEKARELFGDTAEIIAPYEKHDGPSAESAVSEAMILRTLGRRPCTLQDLATAFQANVHEVLKCISPLVKMGAIIPEEQETGTFYKVIRGRQKGG